jgi:hypothetical protein
MNIRKIIKEEIDDFDWAQDVNDYDLENLDKHTKYKVWFGDNLSQDEQLQILENLYKVLNIKERPNNLHSQTTYTSLFIKWLNKPNNYDGNKGWNVSHMGCLKTRRQYISREDEMYRYCLPEDGYKLNPDKVTFDREYFDDETDYRELPSNIFY